MSGYLGKIWIITGGRGVGKTRFCLELLKKAREDRIEIAGIVSPGEFINSVKKSIIIENVKTGECKTMAKKRGEENTGIFTHRWVFNAEVLNWGNGVLATATPCDLLFIDELGPLEFTRSEGLLEGLKALNACNFNTAVVVVRPELLSIATALWPESKVLDIKPLTNDITTNKNIQKVLH